MVPIGDIGARNLPEHRVERVYRVAAHDLPYRLAHAVLVGERVQGRGRLCGADDHVQHGLIAVGEEDRARLAAERPDVLDAVALLLLARELMALDDALLVFVHRAHGDDARLGAPLPRELVDVVRKVAVLDERAVLDALAQERRPALVHLGGVHVLLGRELRLGAVDVQKRERAVRDVRGGLSSVEHVVGERGDLDGVLGDGAYAGKGKRSHGKSSRGG